MTLAEALRRAGYATFFAGKWHLGDGAYGPEAQGFGPGLAGDGQFYYPPRRSAAEVDEDDPKTTDRIANAAVRFIEANRERPFFAYLPFLAVHIPIGARRTDREISAQGSSASRRRLGHGGQRTRAAGAEQRRLRRDAGAARHGDRPRAGGTGRAGMADRTIVIFMSDNGGLATAEGSPTSNRPLRAGKGWLYEGGIREPWIIRAWRDQAGQHLRHAGHQHRLLPHDPRPRRPAADPRPASRRYEPRAAAERRTAARAARSSGTIHITATRAVARRRDPRRRLETDRVV